MWASVLAEEAVAAEARDLATPRQLGSQPNLDNLLRAARGDPPDAPAGGQQANTESSMAVMKAAAAESDAARTCVQRTGVLHTSPTAEPTVELLHESRRVCVAQHDRRAGY